MSQHRQSAGEIFILHDKCWRRGYSCGFSSCLDLRRYSKSWYFGTGWQLHDVVALVHCMIKCMITSAVLQSMPAVTVVLKQLMICICDAVHMRTGFHSVQRAWGDDVAGVHHPTDGTSGQHSTTCHCCPLLLLHSPLFLHLVTVLWEQAWAWQRKADANTLRQQGAQLPHNLLSTGHTAASCCWSRLCSQGSMCTCTSCTLSFVDSLHEYVGSMFSPTPKPFHRAAACFTNCPCGLQSMTCLQSCLLVCASASCALLPALCIRLRLIACKAQHACAS